MDDPSREQGLARIDSVLARRSGRRGFLGFSARIVAVLTGLSAGFKMLEQPAAAYSYLCCNLQYNLCGVCPGCPAGEQHAYAWSCCYNSCNYYCQECNDSQCSCAWSDGYQCGPDPCLPARPVGPSIMRPATAR